MSIIEVLINNKIIDEQDKDIYEYGYRNLKQYLIFLSAVFIGNLFLENYIITIIFLVSIFNLRRFGGGLHLNTFSSCLMLSVLITLIIPEVCKISSFSLFFRVLILIIVDLFFIILPVVDNHNKVLELDEKKEYKKKLLIYVCVYNIILVISVMININIVFYSILYAMIVVVISNIIGYLLNIKESGKGLS